MFAENQKLVLKISLMIDHRNFLIMNKVFPETFEHLLDDSPRYG